MKLFGSLTEVVSLIFRKNSQTITLRPNQATTYTAARDIQTPPQDTDSVLVSADATQTLTNKTISGSSNTISNVSLTSGVTDVLPTANGGTGQNSTATFPTSGTVVTEAAIETLTNKTISGSSNTLTVLAGSQLSGQVPTANGGTGQNSTATFPTSGVVVTEAGTETLTNKTISGSSNTLTVLAGSQLSGQVPIANGGTNASTASAAFGNLSPLTTKGDLVAYSTSNIRLPVGTDGQFLSADSTQTSGLKWANPSASGASADGTSAGSVTTYAPTIKSAIKQVSGANYTILDNDGYNTIYVDCQSADRTITLPATANNVGRRIRIIKTDTDQTHVVNINRAGSDVIYAGGDNAATTVTLQKFTECRELECMVSGTWVQVEATGTSMLLTTLDGGFTGGSLNLVRVGNIVHVQIQSPTWNSGSFQYTTALTFSGNYRPSADVVICGAPSNGSHAYHMTWSVLATGAIRMDQNVNNSTGPDNYHMFSGSYIIR